MDESRPELSLSRLLPWALALISAGTMFGLLRSTMEHATQVNARQDVRDAEMAAQIRALEIEEATDHAISAEIRAAQDRIRAAQERIEGQLVELVRSHSRPSTPDEVRR